MTKLLVVDLEQLRSIKYEYMLKRMIPESWAVKLPTPSHPHPHPPPLSKLFEMTK